MISRGLESSRSSLLQQDRKVSHPKNIHWWWQLLAGSKQLQRTRLHNQVCQQQAGRHWSLDQECKVQIRVFTESNKKFQCLWKPGGQWPMGAVAGRRVRQSPNGRSSTTHRSNLLLQGSRHGEVSQVWPEELLGWLWRWPRLLCYQHKVKAR